MIYNTNDTNQDKIDAFAAHMPISYRATYRKAMNGKSLRAAVNSKCLDCSNWQRIEIKECPIVTCPLHLYRPYQQKGVDDEE